MKVKLIAIAALGKSREIGLNGALPWHLPEEYQHFLKEISGKPVLLGRKNFEAHRGNVPGSKALVLTRDRHFSHPNALVVHDLKSAVETVSEWGEKSLMIMGGAEIYRESLPYLSEFICSHVDYQGPADAYFPEFQQWPWTQQRKEIHQGWWMEVLSKNPEPLR